MTAALPTPHVIAVTLAFATIGPTAVAETLTISEMATRTHVHGLAVDRRDRDYLFIATHHGLFRAGPDGRAERISVVQDFMGFNPHPDDPDILYASGHPAGGGNLGVVRSTDGGRTWEHVSPGAGGPVDFHQMTVSPADPRTIFGAYGGLQVSHDGGRNWTVVGPAPDRLIDLAASAADVRRLYAATETGLLVSRNAGDSWERVLGGAPVSMVEVGPHGAVHAFVLGRGLVKADEDSLEFETVSDAWEERFVLHLAVDPLDPGRLFGATQDGSILASTDGGGSWVEFGR